MINVSLSPDPTVRPEKGGNYAYIVHVLNSIPNVLPAQDASRGKLEAALTSTKPLFVTSETYAPGGGDVYCLNVMVDRQDYRLIIGYDSQVVRVETLDARAARAQTRNDRAGHSPQNAAAADAVGTAGDNDDNYNTDDPYGVMRAVAPNPYGVMHAVAPNPYGRPVPGPSGPYGVPIPAPE
jgi:hypothetical protein